MLLCAMHISVYLFKYIAKYNPKVIIPSSTEMLLEGLKLVLGYREKLSNFIQVIVVCISYSWFLTRTIKVNETNYLLIRIFRHGAFDSMVSKEIIGGPKQSVIGQPIYTHFYTLCRPFLFCVM